MRYTPRLVSVATAVPEHVLLQSDVAKAASTIFSKRYSAFDRVSPVFTTAGIHKRHAVRPLEWFFESHGWPERTAAYLEGALKLFVQAATKALDGAGLQARDVDTIVTVSSTGIATPSLEARACGIMGFRGDVHRVPVFGLGCAGGVTGLSIAAKLAKAQPGSVVLFVAVELCTLAFRLDELTKANIVATALFGDGAGACILRAGEGGIAEIDASGEHIWPDTLDIMGWNVDPEGFGVIFARSIPPFAEAHMGSAVMGILDRAGLHRQDIDRFICHPGGKKVVTALERALALDQGSLDHERSVLSEYGNMSAPTALFVLEQVIGAGLPNRSVLAALGPGFTASCVALRRVT
ncbi:type III polyketide synthase [Microvirga aerophila]|uniref:Chalcone synthase n=1 Tax=Microvirga aerophila TaxID=670291 RepID=A0A512BQB8_9HYPH|nr:type III polyketide synthase [Microvirga aerophila]GEO14213.1 chalcone synthase [Microvirga aerophila]